MTVEDRPLCDCPEPCACYAEGYAAGKDKAYFEIEMSLRDDAHAADCGYQPCQVKRACIQRVMTLIAETTPDLVDLTDHSHTMPEN